MAATQALTSIAIIMISFIGGFIFFYSTSALIKSEKKARMDDLISLLINFVIFIWLAKIVMNIDLLMKDPFAVLAYPSNSHAFYLATLFIIINLLYKIMRQQFKFASLMNTFVPVFLVASFVYEFIQIVWLKNAYSWLHLALLMVLVVIYALLYDRIFSLKLSYYLMLVWALGSLILSLILPYTTLFGYILSPWYLIILSIGQLILIIYNHRGGYYDGWH